MVKKPLGADFRKKTTASSLPRPRLRTRLTNKKLEN